MNAGPPIMGIPVFFLDLIYSGVLTHILSSTRGCAILLFLRMLHTIPVRNNGMPTT